LKADVWEETVYGHRLRIILSSFQEIPINIFSRGAKRTLTFKKKRKELRGR
jgi:hypothetical protein